MAMNSSIMVLVGVVILGWVANEVIFGIIGRRVKTVEERHGIPIKKRFRAIFRVFLPIFLVLLVVPSLPLPDHLVLVIRRLTSIAFIALAAWLMMAAVLTGRDLILRRHDITVVDNLKARAVHTQVRVLTRIILIAIALVAGAATMMIFDHVRQLGSSILASAGVIGIVIGVAAQRSIAALLAGLQIAVTQPIRIDDVVIIEEEWGQIEEITLTYVVVRIWDLRRLVIPTSQFLEKPFQNWTRVSADLLATVKLQVDYSLPVAAVREQLHAVLQETPLWDGKVWRLQVTDATARTIEIRALMSAANSSDAWELRCHVREELLGYLQKHHPHCLPKLRAEFSAAPA